MNILQILKRKSPREIFKFGSIVATVIGLAASLASEFFDEKNMELTIEDKVRAEMEKQKEGEATDECSV